MDRHKIASQPPTLIKEIDPTKKDKLTPLGTTWINTLADKVYTLTSIKEGEAIWVLTGEN